MLGTQRRVKWGCTVSVRSDDSFSIALAKGKVEELVMVVYEKKAVMGDDKDNLR